MLNLYVLDASLAKIPVFVREASEPDLTATSSWQTNWTSKYVKSLPNKVALCRRDNGELLGLMSYEADGDLLAVEIIYIESAAHSNANLLRASAGQKKYIGIAKALFAYAISISKEAGFDGVLVFKAKTTELVDYYIHEFGACHAGSYDPFRLIIWEDAAETILSEYRKEDI